MNSNPKFSKSTEPETIITWPCLQENIPQPKHTIETTNKALNNTKSFAQALTNICDTPQSQLPKPVLKGEELAIQIPEEEYEVGLSTCRFNLHGRVIWPKGTTPLTAVALREKLLLVWKGLNRWGITSIGKGYYELAFSSIEDLKRVRSASSWNLNPGVLKLFTWTRDFSPSVQKLSTAQVWLKIYGLAQEYWRQKIIFAIANSVGTPICTDSATNKPIFERTFGQYARVLVDIDISQPLRYKVLVERKGYAFFVDLEYENIPAYCVHCKMIGHDIDICKKLHPVDIKKNDKENFNRRQGKAPTKQYSLVHDGRKDKGKELLVINVEASASKLVEIVENEKNIAADNIEVQIFEELRKSPILQVVGNDDYTSQKCASDEEDDPPVVSNRFEQLNNESSEDESKFVDDTPLHGTENRAANINSDIADGVVVDDSSSDWAKPVRIEKDMKFLNESWANMMDETEAETSLLHDLEPDHGDRDPNQGFQKVTRRTKKQKKVVAGKNPYKTRSNSGSSNPLQ